MKFCDRNAQNYKFTGKERDGETGLDFFGARYYASNTGRWLTPDWSAKPEGVPYADINDPQSLNLYIYGSIAESVGKRAVEKPLRGKVQERDFPAPLGNPAMTAVFPLSHRPGYGC